MAIEFYSNGAFSIYSVYMERLSRTLLYKAFNGLTALHIDTSYHISDIPV